MEGRRSQRREEAGREPQTWMRLQTTKKGGQNKHSIRLKYKQTKPPRCPVLSICAAYQSFASKLQVYSVGFGTQSFCEGGAMLHFSDRWRWRGVRPPGFPSSRARPLRARFPLVRSILRVPQRWVPAGRSFLPHVASACVSRAAVLVPAGASLRPDSHSGTLSSAPHASC